MYFSGRFARMNSSLLVQALVVAALFVFSLSAVGSEGNFVSREQDRIRGMSELEEIHFTLVSYVEIKREFGDLLDHNDGLQWPLKVFAWSNRILHKVSTERNPLRECFIMRSENVAKMIRGEVTYGEFRKSGEDTAKCIGDAQKTISKKYGTSPFERLSMTERDQQSLRRIIGLAKAMASE